MDLTPGLRRRAFGLLLAGALLSGPVQAATARQHLVVGTKEAPPFSFKTPAGTWTGISIELWRDIADELDVDYELREFDLPGLLEAVADGSIDAAVAALTITSEREKLFDFSHPFHTTGLGIAATSGNKQGWAGSLRRFFSPAFFEVVAALVLLLLGVGFLMWLLERHRNPEQFGGKAGRGIGAGLWWSAVTMTTVGYGDKTPVTFWGRVVGLVWMFSGIIVISSFTAGITSSLTVGSLHAKVSGPEALGQVRVVSVPGSTSEQYLNRRHVRFRPVGSPEEGLRILARGETDALVYDAPILRYLVTQDYPGTLEILPQRFDRQDYGIAFPSGSALREPVNRELIQRIRQPEWQELLHQFLGD